MTALVERARSRRPITWLTIVGVLLLPVVIGGILIAALYDPTERLDNMSAAIVNNDEPVELDGQVVPLGRQLSAGLVEGSDDLDSNLDWTISNDDDAAEGLADGTYAAVITIPENFSAAATSTAGDDPEQAVIEVTTSPESLIVDDAITAQITTTAASLVGTELSEMYLQNVFLGFTTLGDQLGDAADGASELADGATSAQTGADELANGLTQIADGTGELATGASGLAAGGSEIASGADGIGAGAADASAGLDQLAAANTTIASETRQLSDGLTQIAGATSQIPTIPQEIVDAADAVAANSTEIAAQVNGTAAALDALAADCLAQGAPADICAALTQISDDANAALPTVNEVLANSDAIAAGVSDFQYLGPELTAAITASADGAAQIADAIDGVAAGTAEAAAGVSELSGGAYLLGDGAQELASGAAALGSGASQLADAGYSASDGATDLSDGIGQLADGNQELADGLYAATDEIPSYTDEEAESLATVVADPVSAAGTTASFFGGSAIPLLAALALWFGGLASYVAFEAGSRRALGSRRPSAVLALRAFAPGALVGALQGLLVAIVVQFAASYTWGEWSIFAAVSIIAGVAFAAVNQALVAVFGGAGRWISAAIGVLAVATGIVSTVPGVLDDVAGILPTHPAYAAMLAALTPATGVGAGVIALVIWAALSLIATIIAVAQRRKTTARRLLAASPA